MRDRLGVWLGVFVWLELTPRVCERVLDMDMEGDALAVPLPVPELDDEPAQGGAAGEGVIALHGALEP